MLIFSSGHTSKADTIDLCFHELKKTLFSRLVTFEEDALKLCSGRKEQYGHENKCRPSSLASVEYSLVGRGAEAPRYDGE
jgi:hypothetical protein